VIGEQGETIDIFVTRKLPAQGEAVLEAAAVGFHVGQVDEESGLERADLLAGAARARVLLSLLTEEIDEEILKLPALLGVANMAVGYNNIDVATANDLGVPISNTPGVLTDTTADLTWALILGVARQIPQAHEYMSAGRYKIWGPNLFLGADVSRGGSGRQKVLGIVGFGRIGQAVARRAAGFDMRVLANDPRHRERIDRSDLAEWAEWDELLAGSDFVTVHAPLDERTRHLIGEAEMRLMKRTAFLINTARGPIVDEQALVRALRNGWIAGAGLDVYEHEPSVLDGLLDLPNVVRLPHVGSASEDTRGRMAATAAVNALAHLRHERAPNVVNSEVYSTEAYRRRIAGSEARSDVGSLDAGVRREFR
jgi:glyoxylate reductase